MVKNNIAVHALWLTNSTPARPDHLGSVNRLLKTFCELDICCALVGTYPAYIAGVLSSHYVDSLRLSQLCIARTDSPILDNIYRKCPNFQIEPFRFSITADKEFANYRDYSVYEITHGDVTVPFLLAVIDVSVNCGSKSNINLAEFMWGNASIFALKMYGTVCIPLDTLTVSYLHHHGATSGGWSPDSLLRKCSKEYHLYSDLS